MSDADQLLAMADQVVAAARKAGADVAEATARDGFHLSVRVRKQNPELVEEANSRAVGLRVMRGQQVATTHTSDLSTAGLARLVEDAVELAGLAQPDPYAGAPAASELCDGSGGEELQLYDDAAESFRVSDAMAMARQGEAAAFARDSRITNSEGSNTTCARGGSVLVTSGGFHGYSRGTYLSLVVRPVADDADGKKRSGHHWSAKRHRAELDPPDQVGVEAARRTLRQLGARKIPTCEVPVVFDPDAARGILGLLAGCLLGSSVWRKATYLLKREGSTVASPLVTVVDDPLLPKGPGSRPFDGEGIRSRRNVVVERGVLKTFLLDTYCARKLSRSASTASASRSSNGSVAPSTTNFILAPGSMSPEELIRSTPRGLYVTETMGFGFNGVTGDFSRGASGSWIEKGELAQPVSEVTISLNLDQLLQRIDAIASDLDLRTSTASPTFRVSAMTVSGS